jgi:rubrerythrin
MKKNSQCDPLEALNDALCREQEGHDFYLNAVKLTSNQNGKRMFEDLAEQSQHQITMLEEQIETLTENNIWMLPECVLACDFDLENSALPRNTEELEKEILPDTNAKDAIIYALSAENYNYGAYVDLAKTTSHHEAQQFYTYLAEQAHTRMDLLMLSYEAISLYSGV